ncbi:GNAT family N-acetyltransferase [Halobacterium yunchengense]|uniref:GNAT family N-acetyltransferase n=1 Tax=Halobacterium yunchengense TaxID=3108497 RepID=UPI00300BF27E
MSIEVRRADDADRWDDLVAAADHPTPFHRWDALDVFAAHAGADCHRLVGYKGQEPVGLFPVFTLSKGPVTAAFSPPPNLKLPYLGPTMVWRQSAKRRRRDKRHRRFVDACLAWLEDEYAPRFTLVRTAPGYEDVRPFVWRDFAATPRYTYVVDLDRPADDLLAAFSSDARRNVTSDYDADYELAEAGVDGIEAVVGQVADRHAEQGESFPIGASFVGDLYEALPDGVVRPYVCRVDGEFVGGKVNVEDGSEAVCWLGGAKPDSDIPVNDLLDWTYARDAMERGVDAYDLAGANDARIARYKAKFAPELVPYFRLQGGSRALTAAAKLYSSLR